MKLLSFLSENLGFLIIIVFIAGILLGRVWSNLLNWGEVTDPHSVIREGRNYRLNNVYLPKGWTEGWEVGSILCLECSHSKSIISFRKEIYVAGDRIRFSDEGPKIGALYKASYTRASSGSIVMTEIEKPGKTPRRSVIDWGKLK